MNQNVSGNKRGNLIKLLLLVAVLVAVIGLGGPIQTAEAAGTVSNCAYTGAGGLQAALSGGGTVTFTCDGTIIVPEIQITQDTVLDGAGHHVILGGNGANRVLNVAQNVSLTVKNLTIAGGNNTGSSGSAIRTNQSKSLRIENSVISDNQGRTAVSAYAEEIVITDTAFRNNTAPNGGALEVVPIPNPSTNLYTPALISGSEFSGNQATGVASNGGDGGAVLLFAGEQGAGGSKRVVNFFNTTFSGNTAARIGGAMWVDFTGNVGDSNRLEVNITHTTFAGNTAKYADGADIFANDSLPQDQADVLITLASNIIAGGCSWNTTNPYLSYGYNLYGPNDTYCNLIRPGDLRGVNPMLDALADNGGPTRTRALQSGSPAIDHIPVVNGTCNDTGITTDQRDYVRPFPFNDNCDSGAYEYGAGSQSQQPLRFTIEAPGVMTSQVTTCPDLKTNIFDAVPTGNYATLGSNQAFGLYQRPNGASDFQIHNQDEFGGADQPYTPTRFISTTQSEYTLTMSTIDFPQGAGYFGFWWSAGDGENELYITRADGAVERFSTQSILDSPALQGTPGTAGGHFGNPTATYNGLIPEQPYVFVNIYAQDDASRVKSIRFVETGPSSFESDNHTACAELIDAGDQTGTGLGSIIIRKEAQPADWIPGPFEFDDTIEAPNNFSLNNGGEKVFDDVAAGTYEVTEVNLGAVILADLICEDGDDTGTDSTTDLGTKKATIHLDENETVTCTYYNESPRDWGDAPHSYGTTSAGNGASHFSRSVFHPLYMGTEHDFEPNGLPTVNADGDDNNQVPDDEDAMGALPPLNTGSTSYTLQNIPVHNTTGSVAYLIGWIDFNRNGQFEAGERTSVTVPDGGSTTVDLDWSGLSGLVPGQSYLRLRISQTQSLGPTGLGVIGEVEDYPLTIVDTGTIVIRKHTAPAGGVNYDFDGDLGQFTLDDGEQKAFANLAPGTYVVSEDDPAPDDYLSGLVCDDGQSTTPSTVDLANREATIELDAGETVTCTFTNSQKDIIVVYKNTIPAGGGAFQFSDNIEAPNSFTLSAGQFKIFENVQAGSYNITENDPDAGVTYDITDIQCAVLGPNPNDLNVVSGDTNTGSVDLNNLVAGQAVFCYFENTERARLIIEKETLPDGDPQEFSFDLSGPDGAVAVPDLGDGDSHTIDNAKPGSWTINETLPSGWAVSEFNCVSALGTSDFEDNSETEYVIDLQPGDTYTCTYTNAAAEHITIYKKTIPSGGKGFYFDLDSATRILNDGGYSTINVSGLPTVTVAERDPSASGYALTGIDCSDNQGDSTFTVDLDNRRVDFDIAAGVTAECTFINEQVGTIIIEKQTFPDLPDNFGFDHDIDNSGPFTLSNGQTKEFHNVTPGQYQVTELAPGGDILPAGVICDDYNSDTPSIDGIGSDTATINLDPGEVVTCSWGNFQEDTIVIQKFTRPAGDSQTGFGFSSDLPGGASFDLKDGQTKIFQGVTPFTAYTITEDSPNSDGYDLVDITCRDTNTGEVLQGDLPFRSVSFTPVPGASIYCAFTNQKRGEIIINKATQPAGSLEEFDFVNSVPGQANFSLVDGDSWNVTVLPGQYTVEEVANVAGFQLADISCSDSIKGGKPSIADTAAGKATLNVDPGETVECTFTNAESDLILVQKITDPSGGTGFSFTSNFNAPNNSFTLDDAEVQVIEDVTPNQPYTITENDPGPGFDLTGLGCYDVSSQTTILGDLDSGSVTLSPQPGHLIYCAFLNTERGSVTIAKQTKPASGDSFDFLLIGSGMNTLKSVTAGGQETIQNLLPGVYTLTEADPSGAGYLLEDIVCVDSDTGGAKSTVDVDNGTATIRLDPGENVTCTYTNSKEYKVTIHKVTKPGGGQGFSFNNGAYTINDGESFTVDVPGVPFSVTEDDPTPHNYALTDISCEGGSGFTIDLDQRKVDFANIPGQDIECTFTNTLLGKVIIEKTTHPDLPDNFGFDQNIDGSGAFSLSNGQAKQFVNVIPGGYQVTEQPTGGDVQLAAIYCSDKASKVNSWGDVAAGKAYINVEPGEVVTCTFTNVENDTVVIQKFTLPAGDNATNFGFTSTLPGAGSFDLKDGEVQVITNVTPGQSYTVAEDDPGPDYDLAAFACFDTNTGQEIAGDLQTGSVSFTPAAGHSIYCAFVNEARGKIVINKTVQPPGETFDFSASGLGSFNLGNGGTQAFDNVQPGTYQINELPGNPDYLLAGVTCTDSDGGGTASVGDPANRRATINLDPGETVECTFVNAQTAPDTALVLVWKLTDPPGGTGFNFTSTFPAPNNSFDLDDNGIQVIEDVVPNQPYTITETNPGPNYDLTEALCFDTFSGQEIDGDLATRSVTFTPVSGHVILCGFGNVERGSVTIAKETDPASNESFDFVLTGNGTTTNQSVTAGTAETIQQLLPGVYQLVETDPSADSYYLADIECVDSETGGSASTVDVASRTAFVRLDPGENVTCTFKNAQTAVQIIESYTVSRVKEGLVSGDGSKACYWITLSNDPGNGQVVVKIDPPQNGQVTVDKTRVTLNSSNWNNTNIYPQSNFVCIYPIDDKIDDGGSQTCWNGNSNIIGNGVLVPNMECGDHTDAIPHHIISATAPGFSTNTGFERKQPSSTFLPGSVVPVLVEDNDTAGVQLTESFAVSDLDEDGTPVNKACYWVNLTSQPTGPVTVQVSSSTVNFTPSQVTLNAANWNTLDPQVTTNQVCLSPKDNNVVEPAGNYCAPMNDDIFGNGATAGQVCGDYLGHISHTVSSSDAKYNGSSNILTNGPDLDNNPNNIDVLLRNDDVPFIKAAPGTLSVLEGSTTSYGVSLSAKPNGTVTISDGSQQKSFNSSNWDQPKSFSVTIPQDNSANGTRQLEIQLQSSSADSNFQGLSQAVHVTVVDDDSAGVLLSNAEVNVAEGGSADSYTLKLTSKPAANVTVNLDTDGQTAVSPASVTFTPSSWSTPKTVTVSAVDDKVAEAPGQSGVIDHEVSSSDGGYDNLAVSPVVARIDDNDSAGITARLIGELHVSESGLEAVYQLRLNSQPVAPVEIQLLGGKQAFTRPTSFRFTAENWNQDQKVTVRAVDDNIDESALMGSLLGHSVTSTDSMYNHMVKDDVLVVIEDNDEAGVTVSSTVLALKKGETGSYTVSLASEPESDVAVYFDVGSGLKVNAPVCDAEGSQCIVFTPKNWSISRKVTVVMEGSPETAGKIAHKVVSSDGNYNDIPASSVSFKESILNELFLPVIRKN